jgi:hypothetical protein
MRAIPPRRAICHHRPKCDRLHLASYEVIRSVFVGEAGTFKPERYFSFQGWILAGVLVENIGGQVQPRHESVRQEALATNSMPIRRMDLLRGHCSPWSTAMAAGQYVSEDFSSSHQ